MKKYLILFFIGLVFSVSGQEGNTILNNFYQLQYEKNDTCFNLHTSLKPFQKSEIQNKNLLDSLEPSALNINHEKFKIRLNPLLNVKYLYESKQDKGNLLGEGGFKLDTEIGKKLSATARVIGGRSEFPAYQDSQIVKTGVIPGTARAFGKDKYSYQDINGYISYSPGKIFNFQAGRDKQFWGDGYRSLFLSDMAPAFAFGKISVTVWKIKYVTLYGIFKDATNENHLKKDFKNKYGSFHYLSWNATKKLNFSLFESIIWQGSDSSRQRGYDVNYLNPVIFFRPVEYSLGSSDNAFLGFSFKWRAYKKYSFYGQLLLDEFLLKEVIGRTGWWANKYGIQTGLKCLDIFNVKNLFLQTELNYVRPYTYSHASVQENYGHYNQPLAHPLGANFIEALAIVNYQSGRWKYQAKLIYAKTGKDSTSVSNVGQDIFKSYNTREKEFGNFTGQGISTNFLFMDLKASFLLHKSSGIELEAGSQFRMLTSSAIDSKNFFVYIGIKTPLSNIYNDY